MVTTARAAAAAGDGRLLIDELYDMLERENNPNDTVILELLLDQWERIGDTQMASGTADQILERDPLHPVANAFLDRHRASFDSQTASRTTSASSSSSSTTPGIGSSFTSRLPLRTRNSATTSADSMTSDSGSISQSTKTRQLDPIAAMAAGALTADNKMNSTTRPLFLPPEPKNDEERDGLVKDLTRLYRELQARAIDLEREIVLLDNVGLVDNEALLQDTRHIMAGRLSEVIIPAQPRPVRQLVRELQGDRQACVDRVTQDFIEVAQWTLAQSEERDDDTHPTIDVVRERLQRRQALLDAMVPPGHELEDVGRTAMMHVEHQLLGFGKTYANDKTMLLDDVSAIPPARLLVTSDNYAWDMAELADALAANSGVMRNPLTRIMFAEDDVRLILKHPLGERLRPLAVAQSELKRGVRADTIAHMATLSGVMLEDQSVHAAPTLEAIDVFLAYYHTLPDAEKRTLQSLKVAATDSHTGQAYDSAILEAIQDAKANRVCFHKIGDFLKQAAKNLDNDE